MKRRRKITTFVGLFLAFFFLQLLLFGLLSRAHSYHPYLSLPLFPSTLIAVAIGGAHTAGVGSYFVGLTLSAVVYAGIGVVFLAFVPGVLRRSNC